MTDERKEIPQQMANRRPVSLVGYTVNLLPYVECWPTFNVESVN